jgi:lipopolysaccharide transport protein LptA
MIFSKFSLTAAAAFLLTLALSAAQSDEGAMSQMGGGGQSGPGIFPAMGSERPAGAKTEITAADEASYDNENNVAEFSGRVVVRDPQFTLTCDTLKVTLNKTRKGIAVAEAKGSVVIVQEKSDPKSDAPKAVGRAGEVTYKPDTGEVVMRDWPSIQQGINNQVATEQSTVMTLRSSGQSRTVGGSKTIITDTAKQK